MSQQLRSDTSATRNLESQVARISSLCLMFPEMTLGHAEHLVDATTPLELADMVASHDQNCSFLVWSILKAIGDEDNNPLIHEMNGDGVKTATQYAVRSAQRIFGGI